MSYLLLQGDAVHLPFPDRSVDLCFGSPPYLDARTYGIKAQRACQEWIDWMLVVTQEACRVSRGLVLWVCASGVRNHCYQPAPEGLLYEWWERGGQCWRPAYWYRSGIPGSGGQHWLRADVEYVLAFLGPDRRPRRGRPLTHSEIKIGLSYRASDGRMKKWNKLKQPKCDNHGEPAPDDQNAFWVNNTAMGKSPKYEPGGGSTARHSDSFREQREPYSLPVLANPGNLIETEHEDEEGVWTDNTAMGHSVTKKCPDYGLHRNANGSRDHVGSNSLPVLANPGNLIETDEEEGVWTDNTAMGRPIKPGIAHSTTGRRTRTVSGDREKRIERGNMPAIANPGNLIKTGSGYGSMGSNHAHDNEAPFPEALAEFFIKTACKPGGICLDPFSGSGTTVAVAERFGRHGIGLDIRRSQAELAERRITRPHAERKRTGHIEKDLPLFR